MKVHVLKCDPGPFAALADGRRAFEWRKDDRGFEVGDLLMLLEHRESSDYAPGSVDIVGPGYTGEILRRRVTYILSGRFGVPDGYVVMGLGAGSP